jgi:uncharacterized protein YndB with AHSA1/START domain
MTQSATTVEKKGDRELLVTRTFDAPPSLVFKAWSDADLFRRWWVPKGAPMILAGCEMDVRTGGTYRLVFAAQGSTMAFFGTYLEVTPHSRLVWTNEEGDDGGAVTTVTFEDRGDTTLVVVHDLYPSKEVLDAAMASGSTGGMPDQLDQLEELIATLVAPPKRAD